MRLNWNWVVKGKMGLDCSVLLNLVKVKYGSTETQFFFYILSCKHQIVKRDLLQPHSVT